jgi:methyl-accepting chemotaxis protein
MDKRLIQPLCIILFILLLVSQWLNYASVSGAIFSTLLCVAGAALLWFSFSAAEPKAEPVRQEQVPELRPFSKNLVQLLSQVLPMWVKQSALVKEQTEAGVVHLNLKFADLLSLLSSGPGKGSAQNEQKLVAMIKESERKLLAMTQQLNQAQQNRHQMLTEIQNLAKVTDNLQAMTSEVGDIAAQTNLLALNAAIEAARAGESGRGFAVVATEVRALSNRSSEAGQKIRQRVAEVTQALTKTVADSEQQVGHEQQLIQQTELTISSVLADYEGAVQGISETNHQMQLQAEHVQQQLSDVVMHLQFQDRVSQILSHVMDDMNKLQHNASEFAAQLDAGELPETISVQHWLEGLRKTYTTLEQVSVHTGGKQKNTTPDDDITFF